MHSRRSPLVLLVLGVALLQGGCGKEPARRQEPAGGFIPDTKPAPPIRWVDATVPKGTIIPLVAKTVVSASTSRVGDPFGARVVEGVVVDSKLAIPEGATIEGNVAAIAPAGQAASRGGAVTLAFKVVSTQTGASAPIAAHVVGGKNWRGSFSMLKEGEAFSIVLEEPLNIKVRQ